MAMSDTKILECALAMELRIREGSKRVDLRPRELDESRKGIPSAYIGYAEEAEHLLHMCSGIRSFLDDGRREKAMRWLGFVQGVMWATHGVTIDELKAMNGSDDAEVSNG